MQTAKALYPFLFGVLGAAVFVWFFLCATLFKRIRDRLPHNFADMVSPSLIMNNSLATNRAFMTFLIKREYRRMGDADLTRLGAFMRVYMLAYFCLFAFLILGLVFGYAP